MRFFGRLTRTLFGGILFTPLIFGSAIVPGFNSTVDGRNDDGTYTTGGCNNSFDGGTCAGTLVPIGFNINFFGIVTNSLYVNTNGNVTLDYPLASSTPFDLSQGFSEIIAPFFADVDTRNPASGVVTFGNGIFDGFNAFGVNWIGVGYFNQEIDKTNSFQLLLVDRSDIGAGDFELVFDYNQIQWETGDASFGTDGLGGMSAVAGFSDGTGNPQNTFQLPGSGVPGSFIDGGTNALVSNDLNSNIPGQYIFGFQNGTVVATPEPSTFFLLVSAAVILFLVKTACSGPNVRAPARVT